MSQIYLLARFLCIFASLAHVMQRRHAKISDRSLLQNSPIKDTKYGQLTLHRPRLSTKLTLKKPGNLMLFSSLVLKTKQDNRKYLKTSTFWHVCFAKSRTCPLENLTLLGQSGFTLRMCRSPVFVDQDSRSSSAKTKRIYKFPLGRSSINPRIIHKSLDL